jgi:pantetheine-phosphate adenylyltransferase
MKTNYSKVWAGGKAAHIPTARRDEMTIALYPGTFDPIHYGHIDIARRAAGIFDQVVVAVYDRPLKNLLFSTEERLRMVQQALQDIPNITITSYSGLTVEFARRIGAKVIVRGLRVTYDFELEYQMAMTNKKLAPALETVCLMTEQAHAFLSSSIVKEVAAAGGCVEQMVPPHVRDALVEKLRGLSGKDDLVRMISLRD